MNRLFLLSLAVLTLASLMFLHAQPTATTRQKGVMVLAFDDGYASWITAVAPELAEVGGVATGFVNNNRIQRGELTFDDLALLQNKYKWEIGTHTYHHFNAPDFVAKYGIQKWVAEEVDASVKELQEKNLNISSLVFPYNVFTPELITAVYPRFMSFRRADTYPVINGQRPDGSVPGSPIDVAGYSPVDLICRWIDQAEKNKQMIFLYGHNVLPDSEFFIGHIASVAGPALTSTEDISIDAGRPDLYLVPDMSQRIHQRSFKIEAIEGKSVRVSGLDLAKFTTPGASFMIGPGYGTRISDLRRIVEYASQKLEFKTMRDGLKK